MLTAATWQIYDVGSVNIHDDGKRLLREEK